MPHGILHLDKPVGLTSNSALQRVRRLFGRKVKAGYAGTLDPMATGVLPIFIGQATKFISYASESVKSYEALVQLGWTSTTGDREGELAKAADIHVDDENMVAVVKRFSGTLLQVPPMYSAIKVSGKPLYSYARSGVEIERAPRTIVIYELKLEIMSDQMMKMWVTCSKGTYVRVLAEDIAKYLGTGGYLAELRRTRVGDIGETETLKLNYLDSLSSSELPRVLRPLDSCLGGLTKIKVCNEFKNRLINGLSVNAEDDSQANCKDWPVHVRLYDGADLFFGVGEFHKTGELRAKRLLSTSFYEWQPNDNSLY